LGIAAAVAAGLAIIGVVIYEAYKKSQPFRSLLGDLWEKLKYGWEIVKQVAQGIANEFNQELRPAFQMLWDKISNEIIPAIQKFYDELYTKHVKDLEELKNWVLSLVRDGFQYMSLVIRKVLVPALDDLKKFWHDHRDAIMEVADKLEWLGKQFVKFGGPVVLLAVIAVIATFIGAIALAIIILVKLWEGIAAVINFIMMLVHWLVDADAAVHRFIERIWDWVTNTQNATKTIKDAFGAVVAYLKNEFGGAATMLYDVGKQIIMGLINGVKAALGPLGDALGAVTAFIKAHKGPESVDRKLLFSNGQLVMKGFMAGINSMVPSLELQLAEITANVQQNAPTAAPGTATSSTVNNVTLNTTINTNEISPQRNSAELGRLLVGRIA
jgi:phage-related protein